MTGKFEQIGNKTECALIELADDLGFNYMKVREQANILRTLPFNSSRKKMTIVVKINKETMRVFVKGASEIILEKCTSLRLENQTALINPNKFDTIKRDIITKYADRSLRTLAIAYKDMKFDDKVD